MAVKIRFTRTGRRNRPFYRIGAFDSRCKRDGKAIEYLGNYNPHAEKDEDKYTFNAERIKHWLSVGAQPSEKVQVILNKLNIALN
jgi:small subunit ribosomal protein S16